MLVVRTQVTQPAEQMASVSSELQRRGSRCRVVLVCMCVLSASFAAGGHFVVAVTLCPHNAVIQQKYSTIQVEHIELAGDVFGEKKKLKLK